jgi:hypothetical protein
MKQISIASAFKKVVLPRLPDFGFIEYSAKHFGAISPDGILIWIRLVVRTVDIRRFFIEMAAIDVYQAHDSINLKVGGGFPYFRGRGEDYNARDEEILGRSLDYVIQHLERGPKTWMHRVFNLPGYLAELRDVANTTPHSWPTGHFQFSLGIGSLRLGRIDEAAALFHEAKERFMTQFRDNPQCDWAKTAAEDCDPCIALTQQGSREDIDAFLHANRSKTIKALRLERLIAHART